MGNASVSPVGVSSPRWSNDPNHGISAPGCSTEMMRFAFLVFFPSEPLYSKPNQSCLGGGEGYQ